MWTWYYGLMAQGYEPLALIQYQHSQVAHQRSKTRQFGEVEISHKQECWWHLQCHEETRWQKCWQNTQQRATGISHSPRKPEASYLLIPSELEMHLRLGIYKSVEDTVYHLAGQKMLKDEYNDPDLLHKINKSGMTVIIQSLWLITNWSLSGCYTTPEKNKLLLEHDIQSDKVCITEYKINNKGVCLSHPWSDL